MMPILASLISGGCGLLLAGLLLGADAASPRAERPQSAHSHQSNQPAPLADLHSPRYGVPHLL